MIDDVKQLQFVFFLSLWNKISNRLIKLTINTQYLIQNNSKIGFLMNYLWSYTLLPYTVKFLKNIIY